MAAPRAHCDDEWRGPRSELNMLSEQLMFQKELGNRKVEELAVVTGVPEKEEDEEIVGTLESMEDPLNGFDEKLSACFQRDNNNTDTETVAPVNVITEDTVLKRDEIWNALTDMYGQAMPVDWRHSRTRSLHAPPLTRLERPRAGEVEAEQSDDEELREQLDMHTIIVSCLSQEPLFTAEQVIEEIEEMMQYSPDQNPSQADLLDLDIQRASLSQSYEDRVLSLSVAGLNERVEEVETTIRRFSEELIQQLALRDELDLEKEVKNGFISALIDVQNRQKEQRELLRKKRRMKSGGGGLQARAERMQTLGSRFSMEGLSTAIQNGFRQTFGSGAGERQYLTTVIPYEKKGGPPSLDDLQILTNILQAMRDDSDKVPSLLTDYILKVLCPT